MALMVVALSLSAGLGAAQPCPFLAGMAKGGAATARRRVAAAEPRRLLGYDIAAVKADIASILPNASADDGNHGPFMIRLAWHCAGTYRTADGRGGCDGARIRFDPENSWGDNAGLNEMLAVLQPIKDRYGAPLSWGDLIVLAGNTAIETMGGPTLSFCGGRVDATDGTESQPLNTTIIYVDAETGTAAQVRDTFLKMDMNDQETVALIAGGHAFGRCHADRSGFEGPWTTTPNQWSNQYVTNLFDRQWQNSTSSAGKRQFRSGSLMMLTTDLAMVGDTAFNHWLQQYRQDANLLKTHFGRAWEKLMNRDLGSKPCLGQVPAAPVLTVQYDDVKAAVASMLQSDTRSTDFNHYGPLFVRFAWHCAGTYRSTDHRGGCNGARILHPPERDWGSNPGLVVGQEPQAELAKSLLQPIKNQFGAGLSWADLIIIAGTTALEQMGGRQVDVCPGRTDDPDGSGSQYLDENIYLDAEFSTAAEIKESMVIMGFSSREMTVLNGGGHAIGKAHHTKSGFEGKWTANPTQLSNSFFTTLLQNEWDAVTVNQTGKRQFTDRASRTLMMLNTDLEFKRDPEFRTFVQEYAADNQRFLLDFAAAWQKLINSDRFGNACNGQHAQREANGAPAGRMGIGLLALLLPALRH